MSFKMCLMRVGAVCIVVLAVISFAQKSQPAKPTLEFRVLVLNNKTGKPEKNWFVTEKSPQQWRGMRTDNGGIAVFAHYEDAPPDKDYVSEWSHENFCPNRTFSVADVMKSGVVASGVCDVHSADTPQATPGMLVLFARSLTVGEQFRHWWAEHIYPGP